MATIFPPAVSASAAHRPVTTQWLTHAVRLRVGLWFALVVTVAGASCAPRPDRAAVVDVWCEAPVRKSWREFADAAAEGRWGGMEYWFVMGTRVFPFDNYELILKRRFQACIRESDLV